MSDPCDADADTALVLSAINLYVGSAIAEANDHVNRAAALEARVRSGEVVLSDGKEAERAAIVGRLWLEKVAALERALEAERAAAGTLRVALEPFAELAYGKDSWSSETGCATFPTMKQVRAARAALAAGEGKP